MTESPSQHARELYWGSLVWDAHSGFTPVPAADLRNLNIWRDAGVGHLSINAGFDLFPWQHTVATLAKFRHWILGHPEDFALASTARDVRRAQAEGRMAVTFDIEGTNALDGRIEMVQLYHLLGVRQMLFTYNRNNLAGGGCHDEDTGLTVFGRAIIDEMNRLGMFVDLSHCGYRTSMDAMEYSSQPVIFSHSNAFAICHHERNIVGEQIRSCARTGGLIGLAGVNLFLGDGSDRIEAMADHVDYLIDLAGPRHVGIGLDYAFGVSGSSTEDLLRANSHFWPPGNGYDVPKLDLMSPACLPELVETLLRRGHSDEVVRGVLGENFIRLAERVWR